ncbi:hypothetical protein [Methylobacterium sp. B1]|uniref:hypothetical protein n=1 Tax=Methylobacterium sp. B1 TaxID=91459 RepID=UPI000344E3B3
MTDASFFPSIGAVNPTLTIIANALRVAIISSPGWGPGTRSRRPGSLITPSRGSRCPFEDRGARNTAPARRRILKHPRRRASKAASRTRATCGGLSRGRRAPAPRDAGPASDVRHRPRAPAAPGAWPGSEHEGRGTPREPRCRPKSRGIRSPRRPAASTGRLPRPVPSFSSRRLQRPGPATPC